MSLVQEILDGKHDAQLEKIFLALQERKEMRGRIKFIELEVGDKVRFVRNMRPKYVAGCTGKIIDKRQSRIVVDLDIPARRYYKGVVCTPAILEKIES